MTTPPDIHTDLKDTTAMLEAELRACHQAIDVCMETILDPKRFYETRRMTMLVLAKLMGTSAALATSVARLKGEVRQHITVERTERPRARLPRPSRGSARKAKEGGEGKK